LTISTCVVSSISDKSRYFSIYNNLEYNFPEKNV
jgi:hypothetical protein